MNKNLEWVALAGSVASDRMRWLSVDEAMQLGLIHEAIAADRIDYRAALGWTIGLLE